MAKLPEGFEIATPSANSLPEGFEVVGGQGLPTAEPVAATSPARTSYQGVKPPQARTYATQPSDRGQISPTGEVINTMLTGAAAEIPAGLAGIAGSILPGEKGQGAEWVERTRSALTATPQTQEGQQKLAAVGEFVEPVTSALESAEKTLGQATLEATGSPELAAIAHTLPTAALEALGVAGIKGGTKPLKVAGELASDAVDAIPTDTAKAFFKYQSPAKQKIAQLIEKGEADLETAGFKIDKPAITKEPTPLQKSLGADIPNVTKDATAREAMKQGFDDGVVAAVKQSTPVDKQAMLKMVDIMEKGKKNNRYAMLNRPTDVAGDTLLNRFKDVKRANKEAGQELDAVAKALKGNRVDVEPAITGFIENLDEMGITLDGNFKPNFSGSDIEGVKAAERVVSEVIARLKNTKTPDAYDAHRMKKFIDEQVTYGKNAEGLAGKTEMVLKSLRRDLDNQLDTNFDDYNRVNTVYAETIGAINDLQDVAGSKMSLTGPNSEKAVGTLLRRLMSNAQSRVRLLDAVDGIDSAARTYGMPKNALPGKGGKPADLLSQILFADELDAVFGPVARTSFQGQIDQAIKQGANAASSQGGLFQFAVDKAGQAAEKARGINQEAAFESIRKLLKE